MKKQARKEVSLVIPVKNEEATLPRLIDSIRNQEYQPAEVIFVDGGSDDKTREMIRGLAETDPDTRLISAGQAWPGKGRNIGIENASYDWIALTDAGIELDPSWLKELVNVADGDPSVQTVYGNYSPRLETLFEKLAAIAYLPSMSGGRIRGRSVASMLLTRESWRIAGGFPDFRASEDLAFMDELEKRSVKAGYAPKARVTWSQSPDLAGTFRRFRLYSLHNVLASRQWDWHYGILRQYLVLVAVFAASLVFSYLFLVLIPIWILLRSLKRILSHREEFGFLPALNPVYLLGVALVLLTIDAATFVGWIDALLRKPN